jgi:alcohol dehydrogenase (cytochrome c)
MASGGPITYSVNGWQYLAIAAGGALTTAIAYIRGLAPEVDMAAGGNAIYVFALPQRR